MLLQWLKSKAVWMFVFPIKPINLVRNDLHSVNCISLFLYFSFNFFHLILSIKRFIFSVNTFKMLKNMLLWMLKRGNVMNRKGFTLVELLAVIVILGLIMGIASVGVVSAIRSSRLNSEKVFVRKLENAIDDYLDLKGSTLIANGDSGVFKKSGKDVSYQKMASISFSDLENEGILKLDEAINPGNKKKCFDEKDPTIDVYKDGDYVYYYYVDLSGENTSCEIHEENGVIHNLPDSLREKLGK